MVFGTFSDDRPYIWNKFHNPQLDETTGLEWGELTSGATAFFDLLGTMSRPVLKAKAFAYLCENMRIEVSPHDFFPTFACWDRNDRPLTGLLNKMQREVCDRVCTLKGVWNDINSGGAGNQWVDFDHSVPDWYYMLPLGFPGILKNVREYRKALSERQGGTLTEEQQAYYDGIELTYEAMLSMIGRFHDYAVAHADGNARMLMVAECLEAMRTREPRNTYEVMQFIYLYFMFSEHIDRMQVRSLGNLDNMMLPYMRRDLANGTFTEPQIRELWRYFLMQWGAIDNYWGHPFYLGGTDEHGQSRINELSYLILEEFEALDIPTPKIQLKIAKNTPDAFIDFALRMIRDSHSSLVFVSEETIERVMMGYGSTAEDARTCDIRGCYEFASAGYRCGNGTGVGHVNMLKPFEWIFHDGMDSRLKKPMGNVLIPFEEIASFDDFYRCYLSHLKWILDTEMAVADEFEGHLHDINPSNVFSGTIRYSLERAKDAFSNGCYTNVSALLCTGLGSAVDALMMVKEFVFDRGELTLGELKACLDANWVGYESLRERVMHSERKYGNGIAEVDRYATALATYYGWCVNGRPNARGGVWKASGHCAYQYMVLGRKTDATPDGRYCGEEMSKNLSPVQGMDRRGLTALIRSVMAIDPMTMPADAPLDAMLHPATVAGSEGISTWRSLLRHFLSRGLQVHFNIFDAETLRAAQREPEKYQGLQIRVCGWNVRFTSMTHPEQDMYIRRAENISE